MSEHLGYDKHHPPAGGAEGNVRNGTRSKTVLTEAAGEVPVQVPRDRAGTFEPVVVRKRQRRQNDRSTVHLTDPARKPADSGPTGMLQFIRW